MQYFTLQLMISTAHCVKYDICESFKHFIFFIKSFFFIFRYIRVYQQHVYYFLALSMPNSIQTMVV